MGVKKNRKLLRTSGGVRTHGFLFRRQALFQLSYRGIIWV